MILVANYPFRLASTLMPIKEMRGSVSITILALPIEKVDLSLRCLSFFSWHRARIKA